jgi:hypothetical protein
MRPHWQRGQQPGERAGVYEVADRHPRADAIVSGMLKRRAPDSKPFRRGVYRSMGSRWRDLTLNCRSRRDHRCHGVVAAVFGAGVAGKDALLAPSIDITRQEHHALDRGWYLAHAAAAAT